MTRSFTSFIASLLFSSVVLAGQDQAEIEQEPEQGEAVEIFAEGGSEIGGLVPAAPQVSGRQIEEIQVIGARTFFSLRMQIVEEENKLYGMFNELNSNDDFDIECQKIAPTGTHISQRVCEPRFVIEMRARMARDWVSGIGELNSTSDLGVETADQMEKLEEEHDRIAIEHPEYLETLRSFADLQAALKFKKEDQWRNLFGN
ncbi:MAG: hypothetical protein OSB72_11110 [Gammaproteobacteria bacterium]|nr:hypothetical protein [Gammaproteobacteria bacterium]